MAVLQLLALVVFIIVALAGLVVSGEIVKERLEWRFNAGFLASLFELCYVALYCSFAGWLYINIMEIMIK